MPKERIHRVRTYRDFLSLATTHSCSFLNRLGKYGAQVLSHSNRPRLWHASVTSRVSLVYSGLLGGATGGAAAKVRVHFSYALGKASPACWRPSVTYIYRLQTHDNCSVMHMNRK